MDSSAECGFELPDTVTGDGESGKRCRRDPWAEHNRCVWHAETAEKSASNLAATPPEPGANLSGCFLQDITFDEGLDFSECSFVDAHIQNVFFGSSDLERTDFSEAKLRTVEFVDTESLEWTIFDNANLEGVFFSGPAVNLSGARFQGTELTLNDVDFRGATLSNVMFADGKLRSVKFNDADLIGARFQDLSLATAFFNGANLEGAQFEDVFFDGTVEFDGAVLTRTSFMRVGLRRNNWYQITFKNARYKSPPEFVDGELNGVQFDGSNLTDCTFVQTDLGEAKFHETALTGAEFRDCNLQEADFRPGEDDWTECERAVFSTVDLRSADFRNTKLYQSIFSDVRIDSQTRFGDSCPYENGAAPNSNGSESDSVDEYAAAAWFYRRLESLYESNAMTVQAREYHKRANEARRTYRRRQLRGFAERDQGLLSTLGLYIGGTINKLVTDHGESLGRLGVLSVMNVVIFSVLYSFGGFVLAGEHYRLLFRTCSRCPLVSDPVAVFVTWLNALYFSAITFTTLGYGNMYPTSPISQGAIVFESFIGAISIALFVFVLGRQLKR